MKTITYFYHTIIIILFCLGSLSLSYAQSGVEGHGNANAYEMAAGIRGGFGIGLTYKLALGENKSSYAEGIGYFFNDAVTLKALYEKNFTTSVDGLRWYVGAGPSIGIGNTAHIGASAIAGIEFNFSDIPFNLSLDYMPTFRILKKESQNLFDAQVGGLSIRYVIR